MDQTVKPDDLSSGARVAGKERREIHVPGAEPFPGPDPDETVL